LFLVFHLWCWNFIYLMVVSNTRSGDVQWGHEIVLWCVRVLWIVYEHFKVVTSKWSYSKLRRIECACIVQQVDLLCVSCITIFILNEQYHPAINYLHYFILSYVYIMVHITLYAHTCAHAPTPNRHN
jgi:hypothetical protein